MMIRMSLWCESGKEFGGGYWYGYGYGIWFGIGKENGNGRRMRPVHCRLRLTNWCRHKQTEGVGQRKRKCDVGVVAWWAVHLTGWVNMSNCQ